MRIPVFVTASCVVFACGGEPVDTVEIAALEHPECSAAEEVEVSAVRRTRLETDSTGAEPSLTSCPGGQVASVVVIRGLVGAISYYTQTQSYYWVQSCEGEPTPMVHIQTGSGAEVFTGPMISTSASTPEFSSQDLYILRCQEPDTVEFFEMWLKTGLGRPH